MDHEDLFSRRAAWTQAAMLAQVVSLDDPEGRNRVQVRLLSHDGAEQQDAPIWARVLAPFAGNDRGTFFLPDLDDEVLVVFVQGDTRHPLIVGGLWNGASPAPAEIERGGNNRFKRIKSKNGIVLTLDDQQGQETLTLETPAGQRLILSDGPGTVTIEDSNGNSLVLDAEGISIEAAAKVEIRSAELEVTAGMIKVQSAIADFSGIVKCNVLQTSSVISPSYTPGAGNVW